MLNMQLRAYLTPFAWIYLYFYKSMHVTESSVKLLFHFNIMSKALKKRNVQYCFDHTINKNIFSYIKATSAFFVKRNVAWNRQ